MSETENVLGDILTGDEARRKLGWRKLNKMRNPKRELTSCHTLSLPGKLLDKCGVDPMAELYYKWLPPTKDEELTLIIKKKEEVNTVA